MVVSDITNVIEQWCPLEFAEDFDNVGLLVGEKKNNISKVLISHDCIESVVEEAIKLKCELIICFHPIIYSGLKKINTNTYVGRTVTKAIKNDINIYAIHTSLDNNINGVNKSLADELGLKNRKVLIPKKNTILKLNTYVPNSHLSVVEKSLYKAGAGNIGNYSECSFISTGRGGFKPNKKSNPFKGTVGKRNLEDESKLQVVFAKNLKKKVLSSLHKTHPFETPAYEIFNIENIDSSVGLGCVGNLENPIDEIEFLKLIKKILNSKVIRHNKITGRKIKKVAVLGGSGSFAIGEVIDKKIDAYITADLKYHDFFKADNKFLILDVGHYESEQFTKKIIENFLKEKFPNFAFISSKINTNPVEYF